MGYNYSKKTFLDRFFYWILFVPIVALAAFTFTKLYHDLQPVPMNDSITEYVDAPAAHHGIGWDKSHAEFGGNTYYLFGWDDSVFGKVFLDTSDLWFVGASCGDAKYNYANVEFRTLEAAQRAVDSDCSKDEYFLGDK